LNIFNFPCGRLEWTNLQFLATKYGTFQGTGITEALLTSS